ncbi:MAG TPA: hypothetical protein VIR34_11400 [Gemmatimonadaceae bacterium]|jgi:hypothetical protein
MIRLARAAAAVAALASLPVLSATTLSAQKPISYAPGSARYHIISVVTRSQEQGGQKAEIKITNEQEVSVQLSEHGRDTLDFAYTVDSSNVVSDPSIPLPDVSKLVGTSVKGVMSTHGKVYEMTSNAADSDANAKNLVEGMRKFLLALPEDAAVGVSWTDTTINSVSGEAGKLDMSTITTSRIVGDTTFHGQKAWRVQHTSVLSLQGTQSQAGQELKVEGSGTGNGTHYLGANGRYLGSTATQSMNMRITLPATGQTVPVTQAVTSTVEMIR